LRFARDTPKIWRMGAGFLILVYLPMVVVAWVKVGPVAGVAATALFLLVAAIRSQPASWLFGSGPYASPRRSRPDRQQANTEAESSKHRSAY
jgi:hypothetical protein